MITSHHCDLVVLPSQWLCAFLEENLERAHSLTESFPFHIQRWMKEAQAEQIQPNKSIGSQVNNIWSILPIMIVLNISESLYFFWGGKPRHMVIFSHFVAFENLCSGVLRAPLTPYPSMSSLGLGSMWPPMAAACCHVL